MEDLKLQIKCLDCGHEKYFISYTCNYEVQFKCACCGVCWYIHFDGLGKKETEEDEQNEEDYRYISRSTRFEILKRQKWVCNLCGTKLKYSINNEWNGEVAHIDHIHPYSKRKEYVNGSKNINELSNLQALCPKCNLSKSKKEIQ